MAHPQRCPATREDRRRKKVELKEAENQTFHSAKSVIQNSFVSPSELRSINEAMLSRIIEFFPYPIHVLLSRWSDGINE